MSLGLSKSTLWSFAGKSVQKVHESYYTPRPPYVIEGISFHEYERENQPSDWRKLYKIDGKEVFPNNQYLNFKMVAEGIERLVQLKKATVQGTQFVKLAYKEIEEYMVARGNTTCSLNKLCQYMLTLKAKKDLLRWGTSSLQLFVETPDENLETLLSRRPVLNTRKKLGTHLRGCGGVKVSRNIAIEARKRQTTNPPTEEELKNMLTWKNEEVIHFLLAVINESISTAS